MIGALEKLLYVLTAKGSLTWANWKNVCEIVSQSSNFNGLSPSTALSVLDELAHVEVAKQNGNLKIFSSPACLVMLPQPGVRTAVLTGGRAPETLSVLEKNAKEVSCRIKVSEHSKGRPETPKVVYIEADEIADIRELSNRTDVNFNADPISWIISYCSGCIRDLEHSVKWIKGPEPSTEAMEFDFNKGYRGRVGLTNYEARLIQYFPRVSQPYWVLRHNNRYAQMDRSWGLYLGAHINDIDGIIWDRFHSQIGIPLSWGVPRPLGKALCMCSGKAPVILDSEYINAPKTYATKYSIYSKIPRNISELILYKLGQTGITIQIPKTA